MILLDTHIWVWWVHGNNRLPKDYRRHLEQNESQGLGVSAISCWEVAKLVQHGRLDLSCPLADWFEQALSYPGMRLLNLTPWIAAESVQLPGEFHQDPADQIIVATARSHDCPVMTVDRKILAYSHVSKVP
ncbi:MAG: type II toxin-antitoxin system VapC family toxin [Candidatus Sumerlaeota bacterium]|nr:type II toxin-antitoxin system VapC family toxin [Candidatus Sumerlaeota bacterium]